MSTTTKLWLGFGFLLLLLVGAGLFVARRLAAIERALLTIMAVQEPVNAVTYEMSVNASRTRYAVLDYVSSGDPALRDRVAASEADFDRLRAGYDRIARTQASRSLGQQIGSEFTAFRALGDTLMRLSDRERDQIAALTHSRGSLDTLLQKEVRANRDGRGRDAPFKAAEAAILASELAQIGTALGDYLRTGDTSHRSAVAEHEAQYRLAMLRYTSLHLNEEERTRAVGLSSKFSRFIAKTHEAEALDEALRSHLERFVALGVRVERVVDESIHSLARIDLLEAQRSAQLGIHSGLIAVVLLLIAGVLIGSLTALPTGRSIVRTEQELRERMAELAAADHRKDEFLGVLSHELRNPLAPVSNALQVLEYHEGEFSEEIRRMHAILRRQVRNMSRLVDDLLEVSRINQGKITLRREPVDLALVASEAAEDARSLIDAAGLTLDVSLPGVRTLVNADRTRVAQIVSNLLNNAAKYTPRGGKVQLAVQARGREALIVVDDTGIGIPPEMISRVFEPFAQVDPPDGRVQGGLGIGLWLVRSLVEMHGGVVTADSRGAGEGSTFVVRLPRLESGAEPIAAPAPPPAAAARGTPRRILVVDDNADSVASMKMLLGLWGHEVHTAHDGPTALEQARALRPDLVLLDIGLPGMNGYQVASSLRAMPETHRAVLAALTGLGLEEDRQRAFAAGFDQHITKPVSREELRELLDGPVRGPRSG